MTLWLWSAGLNSLHVHVDVAKTLTLILYRRMPKSPNDYVCTHETHSPGTNRNQACPSDPPLKHVNHEIAERV